MDIVLRTHQLTKRYGKKLAVSGVNMTVKRGEIYGFLGQNGAGKTTTLRMITGMVKPTAGNIELFGRTEEKGRHRLFRRMGTIIETPGAYRNLTAWENLDLHRRLMGVPEKERVEEILELVGLTEARNVKYKKFSLGMKQRLGIGRALLHQPEFLVLDEPTNGLDPQGIMEIRQLLRDLAEKRKITILISSHILSEIQQLATKIGIIHQGRLLEEIDYETLQQKNRHYLQLKVSDDRRAAFLLENRLRIADYQVAEPGVLRVYERLHESARINRLLIENGVDIAEATLMRDSLEDYFIRLTGVRANGTHSERRGA